MHPDFDAGRRDQLVSLIDLAPTIGSLLDAKLSKYEKLQGVDYSAALYKRDAKIQKGMIFNFNDMGTDLTGEVTNTTPDTTEEISPRYIANKNATSDAPSTIYALIKKNWKYAVYYNLGEDEKVDWDSAQFELYDLKNDWNEMNNLLPVNGEATNESLERQQKFHKELTELMKERKINMPAGWEDYVD